MSMEWMDYEGYEERMKRQKKLQNWQKTVWKRRGARWEAAR